MADANYPYSFVTENKPMPDRVFIAWMAHFAYDNELSDEEWEHLRFELERRGFDFDDIFGY